MTLTELSSPNPTQPNSIINHHQLLFSLLSANDCSTTLYAQKLRPCDSLISLTTFDECYDGAFDRMTTPLNTGGLLLTLENYPMKSYSILAPATFGLCYLRLVPPCLYRALYLRFGWAPMYWQLRQHFDDWLKSLPRDSRFDELQVHLETPGLTPQDKAHHTLHLALSTSAEIQQLEALTLREILQLSLPTNVQVGADTSLLASDEFVLHGFTMRICHCSKIILDANHFECHIRKGCPSFPLLTNRPNFGVSEPLVLDTTVTPNLHRQLDEVPHIPARIERSLPINFSYNQWPPHRLPAPYVPVDITDWHLDFVAICCTELPAQPPNFKPRDYPPGSVIYVDWFRGVVAIPVELSTYPDFTRQTSAYQIT